MFSIAANNWPVSSFEVASIRAETSPAASWLATPTALFRGRTMDRVTQNANPAPSRTAAMPRTIITFRLDLLISSA